MSEEIKAIKRQILPILKEAGVLRSSLFGSVVRGEADEKSDIDILVELPEGKSLFDLADLQERLQSALGKKVDIGTYRSIKPFLRDRILGEQVQIYAR
ncbi:MAG: nucleotidyltransferase family protein [Patescibacteria group bacterium]